MNKIYSKVWNKSLKQLVVASELAHASGGAAGQSPAVAVTRMPMLASALFLALAGGLGSVPAHASYVAGGGTIDTTCSNFTTGATLVAGSGVAIDSGNSGTKACEYGAVAIGYKSVADIAGAVGLGANTSSMSSNGVAIGNGANTSQYTVSSGFFGGAGSIAIGGGATANPDGTDKNGNYASAIAVGLNAGATADGAIAMGEGANATTYYSTSLGSYSKADAAGAVAVGGAAQATGVGSVAIGGATSPNASTPSGFAQASGANAIAVGSQSNVVATAISGIAVGRGATVNGVYGIAQGDGVTSGATGQNVAIGSSGTTADAGTAAGGAVAIGKGQKATGNGAVAIGDPNTANGAGAVALGENNVAAGDTAGATAAQGAVAIGSNNQAIGQGSVALGSSSNAAMAGTLAFGDTAAATTTNDIAMGSSAKTGTIGGVSAGVQNSNVALGSNASATGGETVAIGAYASATGTATTTAQRSVAIGSRAQANDYNTVSIGGNATVATGATYSTAIGSMATVEQGSYSSVTIGNNANTAANASSTVTIGSSASVGKNAWGATAVGADSKIAADAANAVAIGSNAAANGAYGVSLGAKAVASNENDVALGYGSITAAAVGTASTTINGTTYNFAGTNPLSTVSVGTQGSERTITNVAAGRLDGSSTDAVNGSQLYATNTALDTLSTTVTNLGNDALLWDPTANGGTGAYNAKHGGTGPNKITNVADGTAPNDAVNLSQLQAAQAAATTHYYSVNDGGTHGGNYNNDGATGLNALAAGVKAVAAGANSVAIGSGAQTTTIESVAIGTDAGFNNTGGAGTGGHIAIGSRAGQTVSGGLDDIALGVDAGKNVTGSSNIASGTQSGNQVSGNDNIASGTRAGQVVTGSQNVATGFQAGRNVSGNVNTAIGYDAGNNVTGSNNLAIGQQAGSGISASNTISLGANATASKNNSVAIGTGAQATVANSVALGNGSLTAAATPTPAGTINGVTYTYAGGTPTGVVSVGAIGSERQIQNVAAGQVTSTSTDAINGSQLYATNTALDNLSTTVTNLGNDALLWDPTANGGTGAYSAKHGGTGPNKITNVAAGDVSATSTDAINGSQLYQIAGPMDSTYITNNGAGIRYVRTNDAGLTPDDAHASGQAATAVGYNAQASAQDSLALGHDSVAGDAGAVALGSGSKTAAAVATSSAIIAGTTYNFAGNAPTSTVSVGDVGAERTITNVAAGRLNANSTDAVNGSQLYATNQAIDAVTTTANKGWNVTTAATGSGVANGTSVANVAPGATAKIIAGDNIITTQNGTDVAIGVNPVLTGLTSIAFAGGGPRISVGGIDMGNTKITNLAPGTAGTDAVNVDQLNAAMAGSATHYYSVNDGGTHGGNYANDGATGSDALAAGVGATAAGNGGTAVGAGANASGNGSTAIGQGATASTANSVALGAGSTTGNAVGVSSATVGGITYGGFAGSNPVGVVSVGSAGAERQITNVAAGRVTADSTDAVNGSQLYSVANQVSQISTAVGNVTTQVNQNTTDIKNLQNGSDGMFQVSADANTTKPVASGTKSTAGGNGAVASGAGSTAVGNGAQATADNSVAIGAGSVADRANSVSVGAAGAERQITNVAAGTAPTDAVNVSQLKASQAGSVHYDTNPDGSINYDSITLNPGGAGATIHNVNAGTAATDAVNVGQLQQGMQQVQNWSKSYTDHAVNNMGRQAFAGVASAIAAASLPQAYQPNQSSAGVALGNYHGQSGIAVGLSTISESGRVIFKVNASSNTRGETGVGVGAGIVW